MKWEDSCSLCINRIPLGGGYWDCKIDKSDICRFDDYVIDWKATLKDYLSIDEWEKVKGNNQCKY